MKINKYHFRTGQGTARIAFDTASEMWHMLFMDEDSGAYATPWALLEDVVAGHALFTPPVAEFLRAKLSPSLNDWI